MLLFEDANAQLSLKVLHALYVSDFEGGADQMRPLIAYLVPRVGDLAMDLRRVVMDLSWSYTDDGYKAKLYLERFDCWGSMNDLFFFSPYLVHEVFSYGLMCSVEWRI